MNQHQMKFCGLNSQWSLDMKGVAVNGGYGNKMYAETLVLTSYHR